MFAEPNVKTGELLGTFRIKSFMLMIIWIQLLRKFDKLGVNPDCVAKSAYDPISVPIYKW